MIAPRAHRSAGPRVAAALTAGALILVVAACGSDQSTTAGTTTAPTSATASAAASAPSSGAASASSGSTPSGSASSGSTGGSSTTKPSVSSAAPTSAAAGSSGASASGDSITVPAEVGLPVTSLPLMPGATVKTTPNINGQGTVSFTIKNSGKSGKDIADWYYQEMATAGFTVAAERYANGGFTYTGQGVKGDSAATNSSYILGMSAGS